MKIKTIKIFFAFLLVLFFSRPVFSTMNTLQQYGLSAGDLPDSESDTIFINPALGTFSKTAGIFVNFYQNQSDFWTNCSSDSDYCDYLIANNAFIDLHYLQPVNSIFGFFLETTTMMKNYRYAPGLDDTYGGIDGGGGIWYRVIPGLTLGVSGKYYSPRILDTNGSFIQTERVSSAYSLRAGFSLEFNSKWRLGYSIQYNPEELLSIAYSIDPYYNTYLYPPASSSDLNFYHDLTLRGEISNKVYLSNHISAGFDNNLQIIDASSIWSFHAGVNTIHAGLKYRYFNSSPDYYYFWKYHDLRLLTAAEFPLLNWLKFRAGLSMTFWYSPQDPNFIYIYTIPDFSGGLDFLIDPYVNMEFNFTAGFTSFHYESMNLELFFRFK
jgi:hypothetical protein